MGAEGVEPSSFGLEPKILNPLNYESLNAILYDNLHKLAGIYLFLPQFFSNF